MKGKHLVVLHFEMDIARSGWNLRISSYLQISLVFNEACLAHLLPIADRPCDKKTLGFVLTDVLYDSHFFYNECCCSLSSSSPFALAHTYTYSDSNSNFTTHHLFLNI